MATIVGPLAVALGIGIVGCVSIVLGEELYRTAQPLMSRTSKPSVMKTLVAVLGATLGIYVACLENLVPARQLLATALPLKRELKLRVPHLPSGGMAYPYPPTMLLCALLYLVLGLIMRRTRHDPEKGFLGLSKSTWSSYGAVNVAPFHLVRTHAGQAVYARMCHGIPCSFGSGLARARSAGTALRQLHRSHGTTHLLTGRYRALLSGGYYS